METENWLYFADDFMSAVVVFVVPVASLVLWYYTWVYSDLGILSSVLVTMILVIVSAAVIYLSNCPEDTDVAQHT